MSILTEEEIYGMYSEPSSDAEMVAFARDVEKAVLAKLAGMELPEPELHEGVTVDKKGKYKSTEDGYTAAQLHQAYAQGAASQLSAIRTLEHLGYTNCGGEYWKPPLGKK